MAAQITLTLKIAESGDEFTGSGPTLLAALGKLDEEIMRVFCTSLMDGGEFELMEAFEALSEGREYERRDFSTPEDNFTIRVSTGKKT